jgi:hypothetical protein
MYKNKLKLKLFDLVKSVNFISKAWYFNENLMLTKFNISFKLRTRNMIILFDVPLFKTDIKMIKIRNHSNNSNMPRFSLTWINKMKCMSIYDIHLIRSNQSMIVAQISSNMKETLNSQETKRVKQQKWPRNRFSRKPSEKTSNPKSKGQWNHPFKPSKQTISYVFTKFTWGALYFSKIKGSFWGANRPLIPIDKWYGLQPRIFS